MDEAVPDGDEIKPDRSPVGWQLSVDAVDAHAAADFWAAALHYAIEDNSALIERLLAAGHAPESATRRHHGVLAWAEFQALRGDGRRILFHTVPEPKTVKNRWHLDLNVGHDRREAEVVRLVELGARVVEDVRDETGQFTVMVDPEGNEFCVQ